MGLLLSAALATWTIWSTDPLWDRVYACSTLLIAAYVLLRWETPAARRFAWTLTALASWGFWQAAFGVSEDVFVTLHAALRWSAWSAAAWAARALFQERIPRDWWIHALAWAGFTAAVTGVLAYYTSPNRILWVLPSPYPDTWGPFLSRNNFAQFLELALPPALWIAWAQPRHALLYGSMAAAMLAAGIVSASRAGAILLCAEAAVVFILCARRPWRPLLLFGLAAGTLAWAGGGTTLLYRFGQGFLDERTDLYRSAAAMIAERPWQGYGLGAFALVYPEFARFDSGYRIEHAHNDWLEWASEGGAACALLWLCLFLPALRKTRIHPWALGIPAILLHALADFPLARSGISAWVFLTLGVVEATPPAPTPLRRTS